MDDAAFSLAHLTVLDLPPPEMVRVAARTGYTFVGLRLIAVTDTTPGYPLMHDRAMMRATKAAMADTGVRVLDIEFVKITPEIDVAGLEPFVAAGAELGAEHVITAPYDPDLARLADRLGAIADLSARIRPARRAGVLSLDRRARPGRRRLGWSRRQAEPRPASWSIRCTSTARAARSSSSTACRRRACPSCMSAMRRCRTSYTTEELLHAGRAERLPPGEGGIDIMGILAPHAARHADRAGGADDGDERRRRDRGGRTSGAPSSGALTDSLTSRAQCVERLSQCAQCGNRFIGDGDRSHRL